MKLTVKQTSWSRYAEVLAAGEPFTTSGALRGERHTPGVSVTRGYLPASYQGSLDASDYVVWSYGTPIAWHRPAHPRVKWTRGFWTVPAVHYSPTTSAHQSKILTAIESVTRTWGDGPVIR